MDTAPVDPPRSRLETVPNLDLASFNYFSASTYYDSVGDLQGVSGYGSVENFRYAGPTAAVREVVNAVGSQGDILQISPPGLNSTWTLKFSGPNLSCTRIPQTAQQDIFDNIVQAMESQRSPYAYCKYYGYLAWNTGLAGLGVGGSYAEPTCRNTSLPFRPSHLGNDSTLLYSETCASPKNNVPLKTYIVMLPQMAALTNNDGNTAGPCLTKAEQKQALIGATFMQCGLYNSTYTVDFDYMNGDQKINITTEKTKATSLSYVRAYDDGPMSAIGDTWFAYKDCLTFIDDFYNWACQPLQTSLPPISYQAIMQAFNGLLSGTAYFTKGEGAAAVNTSITTTVLGHKSEFDFLGVTRQFDVSDDPDTAGPRVHINVPGLANNFSSDATMPLPRAIEKLFEKSVVSMMSSPSLQ